MNGQTTEAAYVKYDSVTQKVIMQKRDGSIINVSRDALCDEDWVYIMQYDPSIFSLWIKLGKPLEIEIPYLKEGHLPRIKSIPRMSIFISSDGKMCIQDSENRGFLAQFIFPLDYNCFDFSSFRVNNVDFNSEGNPTPDEKQSQRLKKSLFKTDCGLATNGEKKDWLYDIEYEKPNICFILNTKRNEVFVDLPTDGYRWSYGSSPDIKTVWFWLPEVRNPEALLTPHGGPDRVRPDWFSLAPFLEKRETLFQKIPRYARITAILKAKQVGAPKEVFGPVTRKLIATGSGFFLTEDGFFLTNYHVVEGGREIKLMTNSGIETAHVVRIDPDVDLALLKIDNHGFVPLPIAVNDSASLGEDIFTIGFPMPDLQGFSPKMTKGVISSLKGIQDDDIQYQIDASIQPGNSGGPLVNNQGELVGVVVASLKEKVVIQRAGTIPQNVNYAIKKKHVLDFLSQVPACYNSIIITRRPVTGKSASSETIKTVQESCAMVVTFE